MALKPNENRWEHLLEFMQNGPSDNSAFFRFSAHFSALLGLMNRIPPSAISLHNSLIDQHLLNLVKLTCQETNEMIPFYVQLLMGKE